MMKYDKYVNCMIRKSENAFPVNGQEYRLGTVNDMVIFNPMD